MQWKCFCWTWNPHRMNVEGNTKQFCLIDSPWLHTKFCQNQHRGVSFVILRSKKGLIVLEAALCRTLGLKGRTPFQNTAIWRKRKTLVGKSVSVGENSNNPAVYCTFKHVEVRKAPQKAQTVTLWRLLQLQLSVVFFFVYDQRGNGANGFCGCETNAINKRKGQTVSALRLARLHHIQPSVFMSYCRVNIT